MKLLIFIVIYFSFTSFSSKVCGKLDKVLIYKIYLKYVKKGYFIKELPDLDKNKKIFAALLIILKQLNRYIPLLNVFINILCNEIIADIYDKENILESNKYYLSDKEKSSILNYKDLNSLIDSMNLVIFNIEISSFADNFKTSVIINGVLHLKGSLCPLSYTFSEVNSIAKALNRPFTLGSVGGANVAVIGTFLTRDYPVFGTNLNYEVSKEMPESSRFRVYLFNEERLTDEDILSLENLVRNKRNCRLSSYKEEQVKCMDENIKLTLKKR